MSQAVAHELKLSARECDDIRVAALLYDLENIEITAKVIRKAVGDLETQQNSTQYSFQGSELAHSLGSVLSGAFPLLLSQGEAEPLGEHEVRNETPLGARIIRAIRSYDCQKRETGLTNGGWGATDQDVIDELRRDLDSDHPETVIDALERVIACENSNVMALVEMN